jgi:exodeoxyribonuclease VII large subunit
MIMPAANILSVSQVTAYIKSLFTADEMLSDIWISGEVSNFKLATSGHCYLTLKDGDASIRSVIWRTTAARVTLPRDGNAIVAHGYLSVYETQGVYQFYIDHLEAAGAGRLWQEFERLRARLTEEGLFDDARKRPIPTRPRRLGVVTSANAAAWRDILRTLAARYPLVDVLLAPTPVQGADAPPCICAALAMLNRWSAEREPLDAIIVARGGGSVEELWAFNDERVARAIVSSVVPVITGVGHETDFTIADFAADLRAPTPTGAAIACTPDLRVALATLADLEATARSAIAQRLSEARAAVEALRGRARRVSPERRLSTDRQRVDDLERRASLAIMHTLRSDQTKLDGLRLQLAALDPARVLQRGYAIVMRGSEVISSTRQVTAGDALTVRVTDGAFGATVEG